MVEVLKSVAAVDQEQEQSATLDVTQSVAKSLFSAALDQTGTSGQYGMKVIGVIDHPFDGRNQGRRDRNQPSTGVGRTRGESIFPHWGNLTNPTPAIVLR